MEYNATISADYINQHLLDKEFTNYKLLNELFNNIPGIDEALGYISLIKNTLTMDYSTIIFDTAPTGHTLKLLGYPELLKESYEKILGSGIGFLIKKCISMFYNTNQDEQFDIILKNIKQINDRLCNPTFTTFITVCVPEFLSIFETERLIQKIYMYGIESNIMIINKIIKNTDECRLCKSRIKIQKQYLDLIQNLYTDLDFDFIRIPLLEYEIRKVENIKQFSTLLYNKPLIMQSINKTNSLEITI